MKENKIFQCLKIDAAKSLLNSNELRDKLTETDVSNLVNAWNIFKENTCYSLNTTGTKPVVIFCSKEIYQKLGFQIHIYGECHD